MEVNKGDDKIKLERPQSELVFQDETGYIEFVAGYVFGVGSGTWPGQMPLVPIDERAGR